LQKDKLSSMPIQNRKKVINSEKKNIMNKIFKDKSIKTIDIFLSNADFQEMRKGHTNKRFGLKF